MYKISVLISGAGSTFANLAHHCYNEDEGMLKGFVEIARVMADRDCPGLQHADPYGIPKLIIQKNDYPDRERWSEAILPNDVDLHVLAGFLSRLIVPPTLTGKIVNIHPSLLPNYGGQGMYGHKVHEAVIAANEPVSGCTVHVVDNEYDHGSILDQAKVAVLPWDDARSLETAVQKTEKFLYPRAILNYLRQNQ